MIEFEKNSSKEIIGVFTETGASYVDGSIISSGKKVQVKIPKGTKATVRYPV